MSKSWAQRQYRSLSGAYDHKLLKKLAQYENDRQWQDVFNRMVSLVVNLYKWEGLPTTIDEYFFEEQLLFRGIAGVIKMTDDIYLGLPVVGCGQMNIYYEHSTYRAVSIGFSEEFNAITKYNKDIFEMIQAAGGTARAKYDGCVCKDNYQGYPLIETIRIYTDKIVDKMRAIDTLAKQLKYSSIIETDEDSKVAMQQAIKDIDQNIIAIFASSAISTRLRESKAIPTNNAAAALTTAWNDLTSTWSEFNTALGINNMNRTEKRERLLVDEVNSNNQETKANGFYRLDQRLHFCENMKAAFGLDITCVERHPAEEQESEDGNGSVHNDFTGSATRDTNTTD